MTSRIFVISMAISFAIALSQCVSPLEPDTPREITPDSGKDDSLEPPPVVEPVNVRLQLSADLKRDNSALIKTWPKLTTQTVSQDCSVDTTRRPYKFMLDALYRQNKPIQNIQTNDIEIYSVRLHIDSLRMGLNNSIPLNRAQAGRGNYMDFIVVYNKRAGVPARADTLTTRGDSIAADVILKECALMVYKHSEMEKTFSIRMSCVFTRRDPVPLTYLYDGEITLSYH